MHLIPVRLVLHTLAIPLRKPFKHGASERAVAEPLILEVHLSNGAIGYGEAQPRPYVTGERVERVAHAIQTILMPAMARLRPDGYFDAVEQITALPTYDANGRPITAARAAAELALLDAYSTASGKSFDALVGWLGNAGLVSRAASMGGQSAAGMTSASAQPPAYSGVLSADSPSAIRRSVWKMRLFGLRDYKLKVGDAADDQRVRAAAAALGRSLRTGRTSLRIDANGAWTTQQAIERLEAWRDLPISCVEQPVAGPAQRLIESPEDSWDDCVAHADQALRQVAERSPFPIMADESLVTLDDAEQLTSSRSPAWFNIRIGKNGGLLPALQMAAMASTAGVPFQVGCLVGETSVLSAAGHWLLRMAGSARFAEGAYGRHLLRADICEPRIQFGWRGRLRPMNGPGLGVRVNPDLLRLHAAAPAVTFGLA